MFRFSHAGFHCHGNCWQFFRLPQVVRYYSGNVFWLSWWRFYLVLERTQWRQ